MENTVATNDWLYPVTDISLVLADFYKILKTEIQYICQTYVIMWGIKLIKFICHYNLIKRKHATFTERLKASIIEQYRSKFRHSN